MKIKKRQKNRSAKRTIFYIIIGLIILALIVGSFFLFISSKNSLDNNQPRIYGSSSSGATITNTSLFPGEEGYSGTGSSSSGVPTA